MVGETGSGTRPSWRREEQARARARGCRSVQLDRAGGCNSRADQGALIMANENVLLVEGKDDKHVLYVLLKHYQVPDRFEVEGKEGFGGFRRPQGKSV